MGDDKPVAADGHPLQPLRRFTEARIGLGRFGAGVPTDVHLNFAEAHARARDAVHAVIEAELIAGRLAAAGFATLEVESQAIDRAAYLRRPDLGRRLSERSREALRSLPEPKLADLVLIIADGLSAEAVNSHAADTLLAITDLLSSRCRLAPIILARQARVALSDPIGEAIGARLAVMLIGERPGLSAADSLGAYLTHSPRIGRTDADRNCVSNIRPRGLSPDLAARKIASLVLRSLALGYSGTGLKDDLDLVEDAPPVLAGARLWP